MRATVMKRICLVVVLLAATLPATAGACSCIPAGDPREEIKAADAAMFGEVVDVRLQDDNRFGGTFVYTVRVLRDYKRNLSQQVTLRSNRDSAACGVEYGKGERFGTLLYRADGPWYVGSCSVRSRAHLEAGVTPLPEPTGEPPAALLVGGAFGDARLGAFDSEGRLLGYGHGGGDVLQLAACPGGTTALEVVAGDDGTRLYARSLDRLGAPRLLAPLGRRYPRALECLARDGSRAALLDNRVIYVKNDKVVVGERVNGGRSLLADGTVWTPTKRVNVATAQVRAFGPLPPRHSVMALSPGGENLAVGSPRRIALVDTGTGRNLKSHRRGAYEAAWLGDDALVAYGYDGMRFYDAALEPQATVRLPLGPYTADGDEFVIAADGRLHRYDARGTKLGTTPIFTTAVQALCALGLS